MKYANRFIAVFVIAFSLALGVILGLGAPPLQAEQPPAAPTPDATPIFPSVTDLGEGPWVVKAYYANQAALNRLAARHEPWEVNKKAGYAVIEVADIFTYLNLQSEGYRLEIDRALTAEMNRPHVYAPGQISGIPGYPCYRTVEETFTSAQSIAAQYPNLAEWIDAGDSWEKTSPGGNAGYDMMVLRLTNENITLPKPKIFIMSSVHAREYTPAELNTRFAEYLVSNYGVDPDVTWLLDYNEFHLLLQANPDGRKHAEGGAYWRKNTNENYCSPTSSSRGADLNRNFPFQWNCCGGSSGSECDETYRGPSPASEPEAQTVTNYVSSIFPDMRPADLTTAAPITTSGVFLDIHSYSQLVLWPWGFTSTDAPNGTQLQTLGRKFAYFNNYTPEQAMSLYATDGTTDDFGYGELGLAAYTFELGTAFFQSCSTFENTILPDNLDALLYAGKAARRPYQTPAGPDALNVSLSVAGVSAGQPVTLTATLNDTRYNNSNGAEPTQNIITAAYYIDTPHWMTASSVVTHAMQPADGSFNSAIETANALIDTTGLSAGRHTVFVRGQDAGGNWGVYSAVFLYITQPGVSPVIEGYARSYGAQSPLSAVITAGNFSANTNPATGYYSMTVVSNTYDISALSPGYAISTVTNIPAQDYQTVRQDFYLFPTCNIFTDDIESGNQGWTAQGNWAIAAEASHSPSRAWTDSPGGNYGNYWNYSLISPVFDLSGYSGVNLSFWHIFDLENGYDYGYLEYSTDGGSTWNQIKSYNGENPSPVWAQETVSLPALDEQANARFRFRLETDVYVTEDGWHIDDIALSGGGPACITDFAPIAQFSSNSPVGLEMPMRFINQSVGSPVPTYTWNFGDGAGGSFAANPVYTYANVGTYTVTLTATNSLGSDSVSHTVNVEAPQPKLALHPPGFTVTLLSGQSTTRTLTISNTGAAVLGWTLRISPPVGWLGASPLSGTLWMPPGGSMGTGALSGTVALLGSQAIGLRFDATGLLSNTYTTTLQLSGNGGDKNVPVVLTVSQPEKIYLPIVLK